MSTKRSNSTSALYEDSNELACYREGYAKARMKQGLNPIPPYLPATVEYRFWMNGWNAWCDKHTIKKEGTK